MTIQFLCDILLYDEVVYTKGPPVIFSRAACHFLQGRSYIITNQKPQSYRRKSFHEKHASCIQNLLDQTALLFCHRIGSTKVILADRLHRRQQGSIQIA